MAVVDPDRVRSVHEHLGVEALGIVATADSVVRRGHHRTTLHARHLEIEPVQLGERRAELVLVEGDQVVELSVAVVAMNLQPPQLGTRSVPGAPFHQSEPESWTPSPLRAGVISNFPVAQAMNGPDSSIPTYVRETSERRSSITRSSASSLREERR